MIDPNREDPIEEREPDSRPAPEVVPAISSEQPPIAVGIGVASYVGRTEELDADNDQESHVSPPDNDGETVPLDEVVDKDGG